VAVAALTRDRGRRTPNVDPLARRIFGDAETLKPIGRSGRQVSPRRRPRLLTSSGTTRSHITSVPAPTAEGCARYPAEGRRHRPTPIPGRGQATDPPSSPTECPRTGGHTHVRPDLLRDEMPISSTMSAQAATPWHSPSCRFAVSKTAGGNPVRVRLPLPARRPVRDFPPRLVAEDRGGLFGSLLV